MIESSEKNLPPKKRATSKLQPPTPPTPPPLPETLGAKPKQPSLVTDHQVMEAEVKKEIKDEIKDEVSSVRSSPDMQATSRTPSPRGYQSYHPYPPFALIQDFALAQQAQILNFQSLKIQQESRYMSPLDRPRDIYLPIVLPSQAPGPNISLYNGPRLPVTGALRGVSPSTEEGWTGGDVLQRYRHTSGDSGLSIDVVNEDDPSDGGYGSASLKLSNISKQDAFQDKKNIVKSQRRGSYEGPRKNSKDQKKAREMGLEEDYEDIIRLSMDEFTELCQRRGYSPEQIHLAREFRRRGKNKVAAQNCRERKIEQVYDLENQIKTIEEEHKRVLEEDENLIRQKGEFMKEFMKGLLEHFDMLPGVRGIRGIKCLECREPIRLIDQDGEMMVDNQKCVFNHDIIDDFAALLQ